MILKNKLEKNFREQKIFRYLQMYQDFKKSEMVEQDSDVGIKTLQKYIEEHRELLHLIEPWLSCINQYLITPNSDLMKQIINEESVPSASKKLMERINTLLDLFSLVILSKPKDSLSKNDLKKFFNEPEEHQLQIQVENITKDFKEFIEEKIINLANKIKEFSKQYDRKIHTITEKKLVLEDFIIFIGRYYFIMSSMIYIHRGTFPEHSTLGDIKKMMPHFSKTEAWQSNPPEDWKAELSKYTESFIKKNVKI